MCKNIGGIRHWRTTVVFHLNNVFLLFCGKRWASCWWWCVRVCMWFLLLHIKYARSSTRCSSVPQPAHFNTTDVSPKATANVFLFFLFFSFVFFTKGNVLTLCTRTLHAVSHPNRAKLILFSILIHTPWRIHPQKLVTLVNTQHCSFDEFIFGRQVLSKRSPAGWCAWLEHWWKDYMPIPSLSFS